MEIIARGVRTRSNWSCLVYGGSGIGKTTLASLAPVPLLLDLEDGAERVDIARTPVIKSYEQFMDYMRWCYKNPDSFETLAIDSLDFLEILVHDFVCAREKWASIETPGYGAGYAVAAKEWNKVLAAFDAVKSLGKNILCICHEQIKPFKAPGTDGYDRYLIKLNQRIANVICAKMDAVFFAQEEMVLTKDRTNDKRLVAKSYGERVLRTTESAAWIAKNRMALNTTEPMDASIFEKLSH
jgi:hypothetical protein